MFYCEKFGNVYRLYSLRISSIVLALFVLQYYHVNAHTLFVDDRFAIPRSVNQGLFIPEVKELRLTNVSERSGNAKSQRPTASYENVFQAHHVGNRIVIIHHNRTIVARRNTLHVRSLFKTISRFSLLHTIASYMIYSGAGRNKSRCARALSEWSDAIFNSGTLMKTVVLSSGHRNVLQQCVRIMGTYLEYMFLRRWTPPSIRLRKNIIFKIYLRRLQEETTCTRRIMFIPTNTIFVYNNYYNKDP